MASGKWMVEGFTNTYVYPYAGQSVIGLSSQQIAEMYARVGQAWENHTDKQQDLGAANTTDKKKQRLSYWFSNEGERDWVMYALSVEEFDAYTAGSQLVKV